MSHRRHHNQPVGGPFLKWAGGKGKLADKIVPLMSCAAPQTFHNYHEPFLGAGAVFFAVAQRHRSIPARLNDLNESLMETYFVVREDVGRLIDELHGMAVTFFSKDEQGRKDYYYSVRAEIPTSAVARAARFIFLNRTGYNGLYRVNREGRFNVPYGRYSNPRIVFAEGLIAASQALQHAELSSVDFEEVCARAENGDFVYLDPPYHPLSATSNFTSYTSQDFSTLEQHRLRDTFEELTKRGVAAVLSNSSHPIIQELYEGHGFEIATVQMARAINSNGHGRTPIDELLITNFGRVGLPPSVQVKTEVQA